MYYIPTEPAWIYLIGEYETVLNITKQHVTEQDDVIFMSNYATKSVIVSDRDLIN
jgi:hypothetical protein